jgi:polyphosphate kinase 2 (PPK2 family)
MNPINKPREQRRGHGRKNEDENQFQGFSCAGGKKGRPQKWPTLVKPVYKSKKKYNKLLEEQVEELSSLQRLHYASNRYAVLLIFQVMDAAGTRIKRTLG